MTELNEQTIRIWALVLFGSMTLVLLSACLYMLVRCVVLREKRWPGNFCGHCGMPLHKDPSHGIALADKTFLVYNCPHCRRETVLSST